MKDKVNKTFVERDVVKRAFANRKQPEREYTQQEIELFDALGTRAGMIKRNGCGYAMKWFAKWEAEHNKKWAIK